MRQRSYTNGGYGFQGINPEGGVMNIPLKLMVPPVGDMDAVNKEYVDASSTGFDAANITGSFSADRLPAWTGTDVSSSGNGVFTLSTTGVTPGSYPKVTVDNKGRVIGGGRLISSDVPTLNWSKVIDRPTTLAGYGITDALSLNGGTMTGPLVLMQDPVADDQLSNKAYVDTKIAGSSVSPYVTGDIVYKGSSVTPVGYLRCNGGVVNKVDYPQLYSILGDRYSVGSTKPGAGKPWRQQYDINSSQSGDITGWTNSNPSLPAVLFASQAVVTKNRVYLLGGINNSFVHVSTVYTAPINTDGSLGTWTTGTALPATVAWTQAVMTKNRVHLLGGIIDNAYSATVYTAAVNADGTLGTWGTGTPLPSALGESEAIVTKNRIYLLGGRVNGVLVSTVYTAPINTDGTVGTWTTGTSLPGTLSLSRPIVTKNRVYLLGGVDGAGNKLSTVYTAPINGDGTLGAWVSVISLPRPLFQFCPIVTKNRVYLLNTVALTAPINADGTLGTWTTGTNLPIDTFGDASAVVTKNNIHFIGGYSSVSGHLTSILTAPISGGLNDYSPYYDGSSTETIYQDSTTFNLPDESAKDKPGAYSYIKY